MRPTPRAGDEVWRRREEIGFIVSIADDAPPSRAARKRNGVTSAGDTRYLPTRSNQHRGLKPLRLGSSATLRVRRIDGRSAHGGYPRHPRTLVELDLSRRPLDHEPDDGHG